MRKKCTSPDLWINFSSAAAYSVLPVAVIGVATIVTNNANGSTMVPSIVAHRGNLSPSATSKEDSASLIVSTGIKKKKNGQKLHDSMYTSVHVAVLF